MILNQFTLGQDGEKKALAILKKLGFECSSPDWLVCKNEVYTIIEVKRKDRFTPPPFFGHGLDTRQIYLRMNFFKKTGIRTFLMIFETKTESIWGQYLDVLEDNNNGFTTKTGKIKVYPLGEFINLTGKLK